MWIHSLTMSHQHIALIVSLADWSFTLSDIVNRWHGKCSCNARTHALFAPKFWTEFVQLCWLYFQDNQYQLKAELQIERKHRTKLVLLWIHDKSLDITNSTCQTTAAYTSQLMNSATANDNWQTGKSTKIASCHVYWAALIISDVLQWVIPVNDSLF